MRLGSDMKLMDTITTSNGEQGSNHAAYYHCSKEKSYHDLLHVWHIEKLHDFIVKTDLASLPVTPVPLAFRELPFGESRALIEQVMGPPVFDITNDRIRGHAVCFFELHIQDYPVIGQLHFWDDVFFYGVFIFNHYIDKKYKDIEKALRQKYSISPEAEPHLHFKDAADNRLMVTHKMYYKIHYISGDETIKKNISSCWKQYQKERKMLEQKLVDSLKKDL